jgi:hypothetical protein
MKLSSTGNKRDGVAFHNRLSALALSEIGDAPCGYSLVSFFWLRKRKTLAEKRKATYPSFTNVS